MTAEDTKKALECCEKDDCDNCPHDFGNCYANLAGYALELINRYEEKVEELEIELKAMRGAANSYRAELERLQKGKHNIKFNTGVYAKIVDKTSGHQFKIGTIVKLERHADDYKAFANGDYWWVIDEDLVEIDNDNLYKRNG